MIHNSTLQGLGVISTFDEDPYDKVSTDDYVLPASEIERSVFTLDFGINLKWRKNNRVFQKHLSYLGVYTQAVRN